MTPIDEQSIAVEVPLQRIRQGISNEELINIIENNQIAIQKVEKKYSDYNLLGTCSPDEIDFDPEDAITEYNHDYAVHKFYFSKHEAFRRLLASKGLDPYNKTYAILKKI